MKLVRFDGGKTGLMVQLASGPHVVDVIGSLGALSPDDPISQGILNGILKDKRSWAPLIEHWERARTGLRRLASLALANRDRPDLVICRADEVSLALLLRNPRGIVTLDIVESSDVAQDPTGREAMERQFGVPSTADAQVTSIIPFRDKIQSVEISLPLQSSRSWRNAFGDQIMTTFLNFHAFAAARGEGLHPALRLLFERAATSPVSDVAIRHDGLLQSGPDPASETVPERVNVSLFPQT